MKKFKNRLAVLTAVAILGTTSVLFASSLKAPDTNLETFHSQMLEHKQDVLNQRVKNGEITQEEADIIYDRIENNQSFHHGTGNTRRGMGHSMGYGMSHGMGYGRGHCGAR